MRYCTKSIRLAHRLDSPKEIPVLAPLSGNNRHRIARVSNLLKRDFLKPKLRVNQIPQWFTHDRCGTINHEQVSMIELLCWPYHQSEYQGI